MRRASYFAVYLIYRAAVAGLGALSLAQVFTLGSALGAVCGRLLWSPRQTAARNLRAAFPALPPDEIRRLTHEHFARLGANILSSLKLATMPAAEASQCVSVEVPPELEQLRRNARGRGWVAMLSHLGNWEALAQLTHQLPEYAVGAAYQKLRNPFIDAHLEQTRASAGIRLFDRKTELLGATEFLRGHGVLGVLVDQNAGDGGLWTPLFGRLASTSPLAASLALRAGVAIVPIAVYTVGHAKWRIVFSSPIMPDGDANTITAQVNAALEAQIRVSPADWLWSHERWRIPRQHFLLDLAVRGFHLPEGAPVQPFQMVVVTPGADAAECRAALEAIAAGRPDAFLKICPREELEARSLWALVRRFQHHCDAVLFLAPSRKTALAAFLARVPKRAGFRPSAGAGWLNQKIPSPAAAPGTEEYHLAFARAIGANPRKHFLDHAA